MSEQTPSNPIQEILDAWELDSVMDSTEPGSELMKVPRLHAKYLKFLSKHSILSKKRDQELIELRRVKGDYYSGRMTQEDLKKYDLTPFKFVLKGEIKEYIDSDKDILEKVRQRTVHDEAVSLCNSILKELNNRTWQLRSFMDWERFIAGQ